MIRTKTSFQRIPAVIAVSFLLCFGVFTTAFAAPPGDIASQGSIASQGVIASQGAISSQGAITSNAALEKIRKEGRARVIVKLRTPRPYLSETGLARSEMQRQRAEIAAVQGRVRDHLKNVWHRIRHEYKSIPYIALEIDMEALARLEAAGLDVETIHEDHLHRPFLAESIPQIEADLAHQAGMDGSGSVIAVIDSGVDRNHTFLAGRVIEEACYATGESGTGGDCPNGQATQVGTGAGAPCGFAPSTCRHGTHVAGIAAGSGSSLTGVAPGANLISIQVFHSSLECFFFEETPCARAFESDLVAALEHVYQIRSQHQIAAVNMSLGGGAYTSSCDADYPAMAEAINNLKIAGIATVAASGNDGFANAIASPACITSSVAVGAVDESSDVAYFSDVSEDLDLFAPGTSIASSVPGGGFDVFDGTSMSAPHVAGAWAVMQQASPGASVDEYLALLTSTGRPVTDFRATTNITRPALRLGGVIGIESPLPAVSSVTPTSVPTGAANQTVVVTGSNFVRSSVILIDGLALPTTYVGDTELRSDAPASALATTAPSLAISVFSPPPGGGTSNSIPIEILPPELSVSATSVEAGVPVTVTMTGGPGNRFDWVALAAVGDPDTTWEDYVFVPENATSVTWTVNMPGTAGDYEFRLFADNGYSRLATSETVTVTTSFPEPPPVALDVSATAVAGGESVTVTLSNGPGNYYDWIALAAVGDPDTSYLQTKYVTPGSTTATWTVTMPGTPGDYEFRLFENNSYTRLVTSPTVTVASSVPEPEGPSLEVSATAVTGGDLVTVTLSNGPGNNYDWIALAAVGAADTSFIEYFYVSAGATSATWTVNMPDTAGDYEFRLFADNGYSRLATSPAVTVTSSAPEPTPASLEVSATAVTGGDLVTVTLSNGPGNNYDWIALAAVGAADTSFIEYVFVSAGATSATWTVAMPDTPGDYEFRLFEDNGYTRLATSSTVTVGAPLTPSLAVSATAVEAGEAVTVTLANGPGNDYDWIALAAVGAADTSYIDYQYVNAGQTAATWTVNMPAGAGVYEFRLFANNGYTRLATSPTVTVGVPQTPSLAVSATAVAAGEAVTVTLANGPGNVYDWIALAEVGAADDSYLQTVFVAQGSTTATWTVSMPDTPGDYEFRLFENNGYTRLATSATVTVVSPLPPSLAVSATIVEAGAAVTVTLANGPGNNFDWIALARVGDPDTSYEEFVFVTSGATTASWTVNMPTEAGVYEFRLFANDGYTRLATSAPVTVGALPPPSLAVSATAVTAGEPVTVTLANGPGNNFDWIALASVGDPVTSYEEYVFVTSGATTATWTVSMPAGAGTYEFRLFENNGYTLLATSQTVVVNP